MAQFGSSPDAGAATVCAWLVTSSPMPQWSPVHCGHAASTHGEEKRKVRSGRPRALARATKSASTRSGGWT